MDKYQVLSRRYRPLVFSEVVGQEAIVKILKNALKTKKIPHAFLFSGIRGTGKTTTARIFARALNCKEGIVVDPCNKCDNCLQQIEGRVLDILEIDGASNTSVNDVRMLKENTRFLPSQLRYKVYIIDEVHMLSTEAFNALLKTLEEPPSYVIFILATTEPQKIPETVLSRCIRLNFKRVDPGDIYNYLAKVLKQEDIDFEDGALHIISRQADGSVRDALSILELILAYGSNRVTEEDVVSLLGLLSKDKILSFIEYLGKKDMASLFGLINYVRDEGGDFFNFTENLIFYIRHLAIASLGLPFNEGELSKDEIERLEELSKIFVKEEIPLYYQALKKLLESMRYSSHPQFDFEMEIMKIMALAQFIDSESLISSKKKPEITKDSTLENKKFTTVDTSKQSFLEFLRAKKPLLVGPLEKSELNIVDGVCRIIFGADDSFFYNFLSSHPEEKKELKSMLSQYLNRDVELIIEFPDLKDDKKSEVKEKTDIVDAPSISLIFKEFPGAKVLGIREIKAKEKEIEEVKLEEDIIENDTKGEDDE